MWRKFYDRFGDLADQRNLERCLAAMTAAPGIQALGPDIDRIRREFASGPGTYGELFALFHRHHAETVGKRRWGDQLGLAEGHADAIFGAYPRAQMIHMVRDPRSERLAARRPAALGWMVGKWVTSAELADRNRQIHGDSYLVVRFEELRDDTEGTLGLVGNFLDERVTPEMVAADALPPALRSNTDWQPSLRSTRFIEHRASRMMASFHYTASEPVPKPGFRYTLVELPANSIAMAAWNGLKRWKITNRLGE
jgi:hypothetical protein